MGYWSIGDDGLLYNNPNEPIKFEMAELNDMDEDASGVYKNYEQLTSTHLSEIVIISTKKQSNSYKRAGFHFGFATKSGGYEFKTFYPHVESNSLPSYLGAENRRWDGAYIDDIDYVTLTQSSSRDVKHAIEDMPEMGGRLDELRPVTYVYDRDPDEHKRYGLIYEDTLPVMPEICSGDEANKAINYIELVPMLLKEIQSLRARVQALEGGN